MTQPAGPHLRRISLAIVDDEASIRVALRRLCQALGFEARIYASGREFIESLGDGASPPDCLLLDAHMPEMTGLEVQLHLTHHGFSIPTIFFTADDSPEAQARYAAAGAVDYLRKPVQGEELVAAVGRIVGARARRQPPSSPD